MDEKRKPNRKRERKITAYLLDEEYELFEAKKDEAGLTKSDYIRNMIVYGGVYERTVFPKEDSQKLIYEINRIGNNINQVALRANTNGVVDDADFQNLYQLYQELLGVYDDFIRGKSNGNY